MTCGDRDVFMVLYKELVKYLEMELQCTVVRLWKLFECRLAVFGQFCRSEQATWAARANSLLCSLSQSAWETLTRTPSAMSVSAAWHPLFPHGAFEGATDHLAGEPGDTAGMSQGLSCQPREIRDNRATEIRAAEFSKATVAGQFPWNLATRRRI